jgi:hypothetical protein
MIRGLHRGLHHPRTTGTHVPIRPAPLSQIRITMRGKMGGTGLEPGSPTRDTDGQEWSMRTDPAPIQALRPVSIGQVRTRRTLTPSGRVDETWTEWSDESRPSVLPFLLETSPADLRDLGIASSVIATASTTRPATTSAPSSIPFTCKGRTRQSAGPPPAVAALRALQVRHEDLAPAALEVGMWPV